MFSVPDIVIGGLATFGLMNLVQWVRCKTAKQIIVEQPTPSKKEDIQKPPVAAEPQPSPPSALTLEERIKAGRAGEEKVVKELSSLNGKHPVFHDITIHFEGWDYQIDHMVIGDNTVFIFETKNYARKTLFKQNYSGKWERPNIIGTDAIGNPFQQLKKRCRVVKRIIKEETNWVTHIQPVAVMCNPVEFENVNSNIPMVSPREVPSYIANYYSNSALPQNIQLKVCGIINAVREGKKYARQELLPEEATN